MKAEIFVIIFNSLFIFINLKKVLNIERNQSNIIKNNFIFKKLNGKLIYIKLLVGINNYNHEASGNKTDNNDNNKTKDNNDDDDDDDNNKKILIISLSACGVVVVVIIIIIVYFRKSKSSYDKLRERVYKISFSEEDDEDKSNRNGSESE